MSAYLGDLSVIAAMPDVANQRTHISLIVPTPCMPHVYVAAGSIAATTVDDDCHKMVIATSCMVVQLVLADVQIERKTLDAYHDAE